MFIEPTEKFTLRPFPDGKKSKMALNWASEKESEISVKEKARRKEKQKERKITVTSPMETEAAPAAKEPTAPKDSIVPLVEKISKPETRKRKSEAVGATNKRKVPTLGPAVEPLEVKSAPPKRKDMTKEQQSAQNKQKREATKTKKKMHSKALPSNLCLRKKGDEGKNRALG